MGLLAGCASPANPVRIQGPPKPAQIVFSQGTVDGAPVTRVSGPHYILYSTLENHETLTRIAELMEGAFEVYRSLAPDVPPTDRPMECYLFQTRAEWSQFTRAHTGEDAAIYLRVNRGGYTLGDYYVSYWIGPEGTASVAAHEGWHQYAARHLRGRLPPFLEEGIACLFEQVNWDGNLPRWNLAENPARLLALKSAVELDELYPLAQLIRMHAGQVVSRPSGQIEAFYAQSWAFARFLRDGDNGRHRKALEQMIADAGRGELYADTARSLGRGPWWNPSTAQPMLEHYLGMSLPEIDQAFTVYVHRITRDAGPVELSN